jgi:hypothetical protein
MNTNSPGSLINAAGFVLATFLILALSRVFSLLIPVDFYFTFESLFSDRSPRVVVLSLVTKMAAPLLVGGAFGFRFYRQSVRGAHMRRPFSRMVRRLKTQWSPTLFLAGFCSALLSAWPMIVYWDILANPAIAHLKPAFFLLYLVYMGAFGYVALLGLLGAIYLLEHFDGLPKDRKAVTTGELSRVGLLWLFSSGLASSAMGLITK